MVQIRIVLSQTMKQLLLCITLRAYIVCSTFIFLYNKLTFMYTKYTLGYSERTPALVPINDGVDVLLFLYTLSKCVATLANIGL